MARRQQATAVVVRDQATHSLPQRLEDLAAAVASVQHPGQSERLHLSLGFQISEQEMEDAKSLLSTLTHTTSADAEFEDENGRTVPGEMAKGALLTKLVRGLAGPTNMDPLVAAAKSEMYHEAIKDLPAWAVDRAIKRWANGDCPPEIEREPNFNWPACPATLRKLSLSVMWRELGQIDRLKRLVAVIPMAKVLDPAPLPRSTGGLPTLRRM